MSYRWLAIRDHITPNCSYLLVLLYKNPNRNDLACALNNNGTPSNFIKNTPWRSSTNHQLSHSTVQHSNRKEVKKQKTRCWWIWRILSKRMIMVKMLKSNAVWYRESRIVDDVYTYIVGVIRNKIMTLLDIVCPVHVVQHPT